MTPTTTKAPHQLIWGCADDWTGACFYDEGHVTSWRGKIIKFMQHKGEAIVLWISHDPNLSGKALREHMQRAFAEYDSVARAMLELQATRFYDQKVDWPFVPKKTKRLPISIVTARSIGRAFEDIAIVHLHGS